MRALAADDRGLPAIRTFFDGLTYGVNLRSRTGTPPEILQATITTALEPLARR